jgi:hypothetical protein
MHKLLVDRMLGTVFVIRLVMSTLGRGMLEYEFDFVRSADVKDLRLMAVNEDDGVEIFTHSSYPGFLGLRERLIEAQAIWEIRTNMALGPAE